MKKVIDYLPTNVEFVVNTETLDENIPLELGKFKNGKEVQKFFNENNFVTLNPLETAHRKLDDIEINDLRGMYIEELEEQIPELQKNVDSAQIAFDIAKNALTAQKERLSASHTNVDMLVAEINSGIAEMHLDQSQTFEIAVENKYLIYSLINQKLVLCKVKEIPEHEKGGIFNSTEVNKECFTKFKKIKIA